MPKVLSPQLGKSRLQEDFIAAFITWRDAFTTSCSDRTRGNTFKLQETRFRLDIKKNFIIMRVVRH